ncbi:PREDICTED: uncharacterized protein LOC104750623 [Camelina sativa]|uniref:Uncharacterized protein LOC104750623 n=1 Tax=Camelina sativa TaxID=90675 RepID=A0ABM1R3A7_CAMSA|nr:PREDICTED: uncharacterized protein LOC104750623 [Camelina sativa]
MSIYAFGDMQLIPHLTQQALISTGIDLHHVPPKDNDDKDVSDYKIIGDIFNWTMTNPIPANIMVISGDKDYSVALHQLRLRRYNILLGVPLNGASPSLVIAGKQVWLWTSLLAGGNPLTKTAIAQLIK